MALVGDTCVSIGNADWFRGDSVSISPTTVPPFDVNRVQRGTSSIISAENSFSEDPLDILYYEWSVVGHPDNTLTQHTGPTLDLDITSIGEYEIELLAIGANGGCGETLSIFVYSFSGDATQHSATALDTSWVWEMLPSAWSKYNKDLRLKSELFWRGLVQIIGSDITKALSFDLNKGLADASALRPARWLNFNLEKDISDCKVVLRNIQSRNILGLGNHRSVSIDRAFDFNHYQSDLDVIIENSNTVLVSQDRGHTPTDFDLNARLLIRMNGRAELREVVAIDFLDESRAFFTLDREILNAEIGDIYQARLVCEPETRGGIATTDSGRAIMFTSPVGIAVAGAGSSIFLSEGFIDATDTTVTQRPYIVKKGLWESGVRPEDIIVIRVKNRSTQNSIDIKLKILDVITASDGLDYAPFDTFSGTFTDILKGSILVLVPRISGLFSEYRSLLEETLIRSSGVPISSNSEYSVNTSSHSSTISVDFVSIIQRSSLVVDSHIEEMTTLREYIELQKTDPTGTYVLTEALRAHNLGRKPITLLENRDFRVHREPKKLLGLSFAVGDGFILSPQGDMSYLVRKGYRLRFDVGFGLGTYLVTDVIYNKIYVSPTPRLPFRDADADVIRSGDYTVVDIENKSILPVINHVSYLWCESSTVEDYEEIEAKYGVISGLSYRQWEELNTDTDYMSILRAIHVSSVRSSSINDLKHLVSSILGVPYTKRKSIVRRIDKSSRDIDDIVYDKVVLEELDRENRPNGVVRAFFVVSSSGNNISANLGLMPYVRVGEILDTDTILGRSVNITDNVNGLPSLRHTFDVSIAAGSTKLNENMISFTKKKLDELKPSYTDFKLSQQIQVVDEIEIESDITFKLKRKLTDTPYGLHGPAEVLDDFIPGMGRIDTNPFYVLSTWFPMDGEISNEVNGLTLTSALGGFMNPPDSYQRTVLVKVGNVLEEMQVRFKARYEGSDWVKPGDAIILKTDHEVRPLIIDQVLSDTELILRPDGTHFLGQSDLSFLVIRFVTDLLIEEDNVPLSNDLGVSLSEQTRHTHNITRGDLVSFNTNGDPQRPVSSVRAGKVFLEERGYPPLTGDALTGDVSVRIRRKGLSLLNRGVISVTDAGALNEYPGNVRILDVNDNAEWLGINVGDYLGPHLVIAITTQRNLIAVVMDRNVIIEEGQSLLLTRQYGLLGHDALDMAESGVRSSVHIKIKMRNRRFTRVNTNAAGDVLNTGGILDHVNVEQGDLVHIAGGSTPTNIGEGMYTYRALNSAALNGNAFSLNVMRGTIQDNTLNYVEIIRQSPISPFVREG